MDDDKDWRAPRDAAIMGLEAAIVALRCGYLSTATAILARATDLVMEAVVLRDEPVSSQHMDRVLDLIEEQLS